VTVLGEKEEKKVDVDLAELEQTYAALTGCTLPSKEAAPAQTEQSKVAEMPQVGHVHKRLKVSFVVCADCGKLLSVICPDRELAVALQASNP
jgi:hypothetical protein